MDYKNIEKTLKEHLLINISEPCLNKDNVTSYPDIVEKILWKTIEQCKDYFLSEDYFGLEPPEDKKDNSIVELVMAQDVKFNYLLQLIIAENSVMDLFLQLGDEVYKEEKIIDAAKYITFFYGYGYYGIRDKLENGKFPQNYIHDLFYHTVKESDWANSSISNTDNNLKKFSKNKHIESFKETIPYLGAFFEDLQKRKGKENYTMPIFNCFILSILIKENKMIDVIGKFLAGNNQKKYFNIIKNYINRIQMNKNYLNQYPVPEVKNKPLDLDMLHYQIESLLHGELQIEITNVLKYLQKEEIAIDATYLSEYLINSASMNLQFGMDFILGYPLKYIHSIYINLGNNTHNTNYVDKKTAAKIWVNKYCDYLEMLSYVTVPVVRTTFELNLYKYCKNIVEKSKQTNYNEKAIKKKMFELLEEYEMQKPGITSYDYINCKYIPVKKKNELKYDKLISALMEKDYKKAYKLFEFQNNKTNRLENFSSNSPIYKLLLKSYQNWYLPENYKKFHSKIVTNDYIDISKEADLLFNKKEIEEAMQNPKENRQKIIHKRIKTMIMKHSRNWQQ